MAADDLNAPLRGRPTGRRRRWPLALTALAAAGVAGLAAGMWALLLNDPLGGGRTAVATIEEAVPAATGALPGTAHRRNERLAGTGFAPEAELQAAAARPPRAVRATALPLDGLVEPTAYGPIPRIGEDGLRPLDAYARPAQTFGDGRPRAVIIVGGMGLSQTTTQRAIEALSSDVTFAFAPYGGSLQRWAARAREDGHEILMQLPLEPFGYPQADPGPRTLLVAAAPEENEDHLHWHLSRITSYTGVMNYMGARFTAEEAALRPLMAELAGRGLLFVDDGSSPRSRARAVGEAIGAPVLAADLVIDEGRSRPEIDRALARLEEMARSRGLAVGIGSAFGTTIDALAEWLPQATSRGLVMVPASAALGR